MTAEVIVSAEHYLHTVGIVGFPPDSAADSSTKRCRDGPASALWRGILYRPNFSFLFHDGSLDGPNFLRKLICIGTAHQIKNMVVGYRNSPGSQLSPLGFVFLDNAAR